MNNLKMKLYASIGLVVLVGVVGLGFRATAFQSDKGAANVFENVENLTLNSLPAEEVLGALTSPDVSSPYLAVNGLRTWSANMAMKTSTSTPCALQSPSVTSTLAFASATFDVSSTTASIVYVAKAANSGATTTLLNAAFALAANEKGAIIASSTLGSGLTFAPNEWLVVNMKGGAGGFSPTGVCQAEFKSLY